jgi:hypothetical protein
MVGFVGDGKHRLLLVGWSLVKDREGRQFLDSNANEEIPRFRGEQTGWENRLGVLDTNVRISVFLRIPNLGLGIYPDDNLRILLLTRNRNCMK